MFYWFSCRGYAQGIFFALLFLVIGPALDAIMKFLGNRLPPIEVIFFRFLFSILTLLPIILRRKGNFCGILQSKNKKLNILRGILGFISFVGCIYSVKILPLAEVTTIFWTMPLFVLVLSALVLREHISKIRLIVTLFGFVGLYFFFCPDGISLKFSVFIPLFSAFLFAVQDIIIKKVVEDEGRLEMIFDFAVIVACLSAIPTFLWWKTPNFTEILYLCLLGAGANAMQYCIFKAYFAADVSAIAPFRYTEFVFAALFGYVFFGEIPGMNTFFALIFIVPSTLFLVYSEIKSKNR